jgi:hypothetical protein
VFATELSAWKQAQKAEHRTANSLVVATSTGGALSASNILQREFYPALTVAPRVDSPKDQGSPDSNTKSCW